MIANEFNQLDSDYHTMTRYQMQQRIKDHELDIQDQEIQIKRGWKIQ